MSQNENVNSSNEPKEARKPQPGDGIRSMKSSYAFRLINYELYVKPSKNNFNIFLKMRSKILNLFLRHFRHGNWLGCHYWRFRLYSMDAT